MAKVMEYLSAHGGLMAVVLTISMVLNVALSAAKQIVELLQDKADQGETKLHAFLSTSLGVLSKLIDWLSANKAH